jgi:hypothetical protein
MPIPTRFPSRCIVRARCRTGEKQKKKLIAPRPFFSGLSGNRARRQREPHHLVQRLGVLDRLNHPGLCYFYAIFEAAYAVCTENLIGVDDVMESPKLVE